jgi:tetratricopeptide (TPR) repeat protein
MTSRADTCPDIETIAAFLDGRLDARRREIVAAHIASCERCYFIFSEAAQLHPAAAAQPDPVKWWQRRDLRWAAAAGLAAAAALVLAVRIVPWGTTETVSIDELVAAVGTERVVEPRLTGGFAYGAVRGVVRSGQPASFQLSPEIRLAAARIEKATTSQYSAPAFHARGVAAVVTGEVDRAVTALEAAAGQQPTDARILSDLAAAYLVRAARTGNKDDDSKALTTVNRALEIDRMLAEAQFNCAYALERLGLTAEARDAWNTYLAIDATSPWADEARERLRRLSAQP